MKVAGGQAEDGIVIGNTYDKYGSQNPIVRRIMEGFDSALSGLVAGIAPQTIHEVGCGEGHWVMKWVSEGIDARGTDFSTQVIAMARGNAAERGISPERFAVRSIYDLTLENDYADLIVCCEVFEHLEDPHRALAVLQAISPKDLILSVPREPLWRALNMARGKYLGDLGNTPGHIQHWSKTGITRLAANYFDVSAVLSPFPWTMIHCTAR